jgi:prefoldin subunit 5
MTENTNTIVFNEVEYKVEDLTEKGQHLVAQLHDIDQQIKSLNARLEQLQLAGQGFSQLLETELQETPEEFVAE